MNDTVRQPIAWQPRRDPAAEPGNTQKPIDATEELLDTTLARVARLEAVLAITGGSVHDVNNLLTILAGDLYLLTESVRHETTLFEKVRSARNTVERASTLMRELLAFARNPVHEPPTICPANHVLALEPLLRRSFSSGQALSVGHSEGPWSVAASAAQFESAVANLVLNARDALRPNGCVRVSVQNQYSKTNPVANGRPILDGSCSG
jgi:two-component system cell cycle sensor histidine kinase/response regulator CckA